MASSESDANRMFFFYFARNKNVIKIPFFFFLSVLRYDLTVFDGKKPTTVLNGDGSGIFDFAFTTGL